MQVPNFSAVTSTSKCSQAPEESFSTGTNDALPAAFAGPIWALFGCPHYRRGKDGVSIPLTRYLRATPAYLARPKFSSLEVDGVVFARRHQIPKVRQVRQTEKKSLPLYRLALLSDNDVAQTHGTQRFNSYRSTFNRDGGAST